MATILGPQDGQQVQQECHELLDLIVQWSHRPLEVIPNLCHLESVAQDFRQASEFPVGHVEVHQDQHSQASPPSQHQAR